MQGMPIIQPPGLIPDNTPLGQARALLELDLLEGAKCPCCGQDARLYRRKLTSTTAKALIAMYLAGPFAYHHMPTLLDAKQADEAKARHWGLISEKPGTRQGDIGPAGYWRLTQKGIDFVLNYVLIEKFACIYDGRLIRLEGDLISIQNALSNRFILADLMAGR